MVAALHATAQLPGNGLCSMSGLMVTGSSVRLTFSDLLLNSFNKA
jgi:hypothetical protein